MSEKKEEVKEDLEPLEEVNEDLEEEPGTLEEEEEEAGGVDGKVDDKPEEKPPKFKLADTELSPETKEDEKDDKIEIVHNGQVYSFTKDKIVELAQKGFDYDFKVGPHGKLAQLIEADPAISKIVDDHVQGKVAGKKAEKFTVSSLNDYEDETEWLQDNFSKLIPLMEKEPPPVAPVTSSEPKGGTMADALKGRDPEFFDRVFPKLEQYAQDLSVAEYRKVDTDLGALCQFYDFVKGQEIGKVKKLKEVKPQGFRVKSGGGDAPKDSGLSPVWKLSKEDFQQQLDKVKGFA